MALTFEGLALIGMPGAGKSTVGRQIARRLNRKFVDTDVLLERQLGCTIKSYFELHGEAKFRVAESQVLLSLLNENHIVLATGGGIVLEPENRHTLKSNFTVVYLRSSPEELSYRLRHDRERPLLQGQDPKLRLRLLFEERDSLYLATAHVVIETGRPPVSVLTDMVISQLRQENS